MKNVCKVLHVSTVLDKVKGIRSNIHIYGKIINVPLVFDVGEVFPLSDSKRRGFGQSLGFDHFP